MDWQRRVRETFANASRTPDEDVVEELAQHARAMYEAARADGCSQDEADRLVADQLERWRLDAGALRRRARRRAAIEPPPAVPPSRSAGLAQDMRYAARLLRRQPRPALLTILTMALGIAATTALFSVTYGVLMKPLPWPRADRLVVVQETRGGNAPRFGAFTNAAFLAWQQDAKTIDNLAAWSQRVVTLSGSGDPERIRITAATAGLFPTLGVRPLIGSLFEQKDEASPVVVLSQSLWRQRFSADRGVLGRLVHLDGRPYTVVGVLPDGMMYPDGQTRAVVPFAIPPPTGNYLSMFNAIAALAPDVTPTQAAAEATARGRFVANTGMTTMAVFGGNGPVNVTARPLREALTGDVRQPLLVLLVAVGLLLVTATANVASLQLARAIARRREMAIRAALGAGGARVTRQLLVESLLLGTAGGAAGLFLTWLLHRSLPSFLPADFPRRDDLTVDAAVVTFALAISLITGIVFGLLPAWRVRRLNVVETLAEDGMAPVGAGVRSRTARARMWIMAGQVAIACVLLVGASLLGRSFVALVNADRGYDPSGILIARISMPAAMYTEVRRFEVVGRILERLAAVPAVTHAAFTSELPLTPGGSTAAFTIPSRHADGGVVSVQASPRIVSPRYFRALGLRIIAGRDFGDSDTETAQRVVVVNRSFARQYLGDSALGAKLPVAGYQPPEGDSAKCTVIGVVDDVRYITTAASSQPELYYSHRQMNGRLGVTVVTLMIRASGDPAAIAPLLRTVVREADDRLVPEAVMTFENRLLTTLARPRLYAILLGGFAGCALIVAAVGLFGVLSYSVAQRSRELAVLAALGATRGDIVRLVLAQGLAVALAGLAGGLLGSLALMRWISTLLYGVTPHDGVTYIVVPVVLLVVSALACLAPAWRAARLDPLRVLRGN